MMKKGFTLLMALVMLTSSLPVGAFAAGGMITSQALTAAVSMVGTEEELALYHSGMPVDETLTAREMIFWLDDVLQVEVHTLENHYEDIENKLYSLSQDDPAKYARLTSGAYADLPNLIYERFRRTIDIRMRLEHWRDRLRSASTDILMGKEQLTAPNADLRDYDVRRLSYEIRQGAADIQEVRGEMAAEAVSLLEELQEQADYLQGIPIGSGAYGAEETGSLVINEWNDQLLGDSYLKTRTMTASVSELFPQQQSLLARLNPISAAEAADGNTATLIILDDHQFAVTVKNRSDLGIEGAHVEVVDVRAENNPKSESGETGESGSIVFSTDGYDLEDDYLQLNVKVTKEGYQDIIVEGAEIKKGSNILLNMQPPQLYAESQEKEPYISKVSWGGMDDKPNDILYSEYTAISNPENDHENKITVTVNNPSSHAVRVILVYLDRDGKQYYHSMMDGDRTEVPAGKTDVEMTLKGPWRRKLKAQNEDDKLYVSDNGTKVEKSAGVLMFLIQQGTDNDTTSFREGQPKWTKDTVLVKTQLKTVAAKLTGPIVDKNLNASFLSTTSLFSLDIPLNTKPDAEWFKNLNLSLDLPFTAYKPKLYGATNGAMVLALGVEVPSALGKPLSGWKTADMKDIDKETKKYSKDNAFLQYFFSNGAIYGNAKKNGGMGFRKVKADFFPFAAVTWKWEYSALNGKWVGVDMSGALGVTVAVSVSFSGIYMAGPVPLTAGVNFSGALTLAANLAGNIGLRDGEDLTEQNISDTAVDPKLSGGSVAVRITVTAFGGVGIKGFLSFTINFYFFFNILFEITGNGLHVSITWGIGFYALLELIFAKIKLNIWDLPTKPILDKYWYWDKDNNEDESALLPSFSDLFITRARADTPAAPEPEPLMADDYPDLVPESERILGPIPMSGSGMQVVEIQGEPYAFFIEAGAGSNGKNRVTWRRISTGQTGNFDQALKDASEGKNRYRVREGGSLDTGGWIDRYFETEEEKNKVRGFYERNDLTFTVVRMLPNTDESDDVLKTTYQEMYMLVALCANAEVQGETIKALDDPQVYTLGLIRQEDGSLDFDIPIIQTNEENTSVQLDDAMLIRDLQSAELGKYTHMSADELVQSGLSAVATINFSEPYADKDGVRNNRFTTLATNVLIGDCDIEVKHGFPQTHTTGGKFSHFMPGMYSITTSGANIVGQNPKRSGIHDHTYYSEQNAQEDGSLTLRRETWLSGSLCVNLAEQKNIVYWDVLVTPSRDLLFWLEKEESETTGEHYHMYAASLAHDFIVEKDLITDLDITVNGLSFEIQQVGNTVYVYWIESTTDPQNKEDSICRLRGVAYDPQAGIASDDFILAQFKPPKDQSIRQILLTEDGYGYYVMNDRMVEAGSQQSDAQEGTVYRFPFQLIASLDIKSVHLSQDVICIGENDTVYVTLVNNGNVAITSFDVMENLLGKDGSVTAVQNTHIDAVHPENNMLHMVGDSERHDIRGDHAAWRVKPIMDEMTQTYWQITQTVRSWWRQTGISYGHKDETKEVEMTASEILPGQAATFLLMMKVPSSWKNEQKLRFDLNQYSATARYMRTAALNAGLMEPSLLLNDEPELVYVRGTDGKMRLSGSSLLRNGGDAALFAMEVDEPESATLDHQLHNIVVNDRIYRDLNDVRRVSIYITDDAAHMTPVRWYCNVYLDGAETPVYMNLPYEEESTSHARTHTVDLPVDVLTGGKNVKRIKVEVRGTGIEETTLQDNYFYIDMEADDPLRITLQPEDANISEEETAVFFVGVAGGTPPYTYQWQVSEGNNVWTDLEGMTDDTLTLAQVALDRNGTLYRCVVTDFHQSSVTSNPALLTVTRPIPKTEDSGHPGLWLALILIGICALGSLAVRGGKIRQKRR